jgi:osmoprotectant transport system permease protein
MVAQDFFWFIEARLPELWQKTAEHLVLTGMSTFLAILAGIPLGMLVVRRQGLGRLILGGAGIIQTVPSLAMLAFLLPFLGIGFKPAIVALVLYALLPIIRNTYTGLNNIAPEILEAARGLGFTSRQQLLWVELPLAMPVILAGVRTAAVIGVGIATLSSFIGAGGLGDFINRGLALNDHRLILLGATMAAALALLVDFIFGLLEKIFSRKKRGRSEK